MSNTIPIQEWLHFIDSEYLSTFIKDGGASVKFAVTPEQRKPELYRALKAQCQELDYIFVELDAITSRVHMPQDLFFALARQIDWRLLARRMVLRLAEERGFNVDEIDLTDNSENIFRALGLANNLDARFILQDIRRAIETRVYKNQHMARDFKVAMTHLCTNMGSGESTQPLLDWLTGENTRIGNVRTFYIRTSINRTTARHFIESAMYWVRHVGFAGTVVLLDNTRVTVGRNPRDGKRYYTRAMTIDHYELLREFIDDVDRLTATMIAIVTNIDFVDDLSIRSWKIYPALQTRIMDDVRDRNLINPVAALMRLS
ncbi:MAG: DUF2791 family P-loop domain-containing protein [Caldilineaceae bacterium]|nr:DUF2791 family P-loop domain-containing protein [Caldilineaceae bacterium]